MNDRFTDEFERLLRQHGRLIALLYLLDANIDARRDLERDNDLPINARRSVEVERSREKIQKHLAEVKRDIDGIVQLMIKQATKNDG